MKILPVLDLLDGVVVRGVAGKRDEYRPVESCLSATADVETVAQAFREKLGLQELYVADLDAIIQQRPNLSTYRKLADNDFRLMIDAGLRDVSLANNILDVGAAAVIAGLETIPGPSFLCDLCEKLGSQRIIFSLDMQAGKLLGDLQQWKGTTPFEIAAEAIEAGIERTIVLDLAQVGVSQGIGTEKLCQQLQEKFPTLEIITGGGVRNLDDLRRLQKAGIDGVLVASAMHNGMIGREQVDEIRHVEPSQRSKTSG